MTACSQQQFGGSVRYILKGEGILRNTFCARMFCPSLMGDSWTERKPPSTDYGIGRDETTWRWLPIDSVPHRSQPPETERYTSVTMVM